MTEWLLEDPSGNRSRSLPSALAQDLSYPRQQRKVFGIGLSRTGTTTLHSIFQMLGLRSRHFLGVDLAPAATSMIDLDAACDTPIPRYYKELAQLYPNSRFILTTRPEEEWLRSMEWMFCHGKVIWNYGVHIHRYHREFYGTCRYSKRILLEAWRNHHREVKRFFGSSDRLLEIDVRELSTGAIADFLGLPDPKLPVPHRNARRNARLVERMRYATRMEPRLALMNLADFAGHRVRTGESGS